MATAEERAAAHLARLLQVGVGARKRVTFALGGVTFVIEDPYLTPDGKGIGVTLSASTGTGPSRVDLPTDNPYQFFNPPLGVVTQQATYDANGNEITPRVVDSSDVLNAAKEMVYEAVTLRAKQLGWTP